MYYSCKDKSLSETSGFQEKITADGMNNLVLKQEALQIYYEHNYYIYNNFIKLDFIIQQYVSVLLDIFYMILYNKSLAFLQRQLALKLLYSINNRR